MARKTQSRSSTITTPAVESKIRRHAMFGDFLGNGLDVTKRKLKIRQFFLVISQVAN